MVRINMASILFFKGDVNNLKDISILDNVTNNDNWYIKKGVIVRDEPQYYGLKFAYDLNICRSYFLDNIEHYILKTLNYKPYNFIYLSRKISNTHLINRTIFDSAMRKLIKSNLITNEQSKSKIYPIERLGVKIIDKTKVATKVPVMSFPSEVDICITRRCQLKCVHCNIDANKNFKKELSSESWINIFEQLERYNILKVTLSGGEPLLYPSFHTIIQDLTKRNFLKVLLTNGFSLTEEIAMMLSIANFYVVLSLDGGTSSTHDLFRGKKGAFKAVLNGLKLLQRYNVKTKITTVLNKQNVSEIEEIISICIKYGVISVTFTLLDEIGRGQHAKEWIISNDQYLSAKSKIDKQIEKTSDRIEIFMEDPKIYIANDEVEGIWCKAGTYGFALDCDGTLYPCNLCYQLEFYPIGNAELGDLYELWRDPKWEFFRGTVELRHLIDCSVCMLASKCTLKACKARAFLNGNVYGKPYACPLENMYEKI